MPSVTLRLVAAEVPPSSPTASLVVPRPVLRLFSASPRPRCTHSFLSLPCRPPGTRAPRRALINRSPKAERKVSPPSAVPLHCSQTAQAWWARPGGLRLFVYLLFASLRLCVSAGERRDRWRGEHRGAEVNVQQYSRESVSKTESGRRAPALLPLCTRRPLLVSF
ncbi:uncharacterized protein LOC135107371 isoform X2 [Scylla paramamosain]|uniref:uncharacterized protein LOC135107371 isoform X2 n=1 Tax=Scylla paramamosain TaxID=85552 RepID=UPI0030835EF0